MAVRLLLSVMLAGGIGSGVRYLAGVSMAGTAFPYATVVINLVGCFLLGLVAQLASTGSFSAETRIIIATGLLGGFTTYSSFNQETLTMLMGGAFGAAAINIAATLVGGLAAGGLGMAAGRLLSA
jgi:CrcB protein